MRDDIDNPAPATEDSASGRGSNFIEEMAIADLESGKYPSVVTRFPPEPNGYLHIGHAKAICLNFGLAAQLGGRCHLRFDDTNPTTEDPEYVAAIQNDIRWLGFDWGENLYYASDYFERMYAFAEDLIRAGKAYVDSSTEAEIRERRGTITEAGTPSPHRERSVDENLDLFRRMRAGEFDDGEHVLRAKIDMAANNMLLRDPLLYRIRKAHHYRQGDAWCIYPMYDYAHCLEDAIEGVTHSLCSIEFENNRAVYDWVLENTGFTHPRSEQTEFARLNLGFTVMSKRKLLQLVNEEHVSGWDDPRMPTLSGLRRRGYTPSSIRSFCERIGVARTYNVIDVGLLEHSVRDDLNHRAPRVMAVLDPLEVVIENYPEGQSEELDADYWPRDVPKEGTRKVPFSRRLYIERDDFMEDPPAGYKRLAPGREVRLRYAYFLRCEGVEKNADGEIVRLRCSYDPETRGGNAPDGRKVSGTIHWLSADHALDAEVRVYDRLFASEKPDGDFHEHLNPNSLSVIPNAKLEPSLAGTEGGSHFQFERLGYFFTDPVDSTADALVWNRTVTLRDTWAKVQKAGETEEKLRAEERARKRAEQKERQRQLAAESEPEALAPEHEADRSAYVERGVPDQDARLFALDPELASFFEAAFGSHDEPRSVARWLTTELLGRLGDRALSDLPFGGAELGELARMVDEAAINNTVGKDVLDRMLDSGGSPERIVEEAGLRQVSDSSVLGPVIEEVLAANAGQVEAYRGGKTALFGFFVGQVMRSTGGKADPQQVRQLLQAALEG